jgi:hypothetical protein
LQIVTLFRQFGAEGQLEKISALVYSLVFNLPESAQFNPCFIRGQTTVSYSAFMPPSSIQLSSPPLSPA